MPRMWRIVIGNWWTSSGRTIASIISVGLGVATVVVVTSFYETARRTITDEVVTHWLGSAHLSVHPVGSHWASLDASFAEVLSKLDNVQHTTVRLRRRARIISQTDSDALLESHHQWVDLVGIVPDAERHFRTVPNLRGRMIQAGQRSEVVIESTLARAWLLSLGDLIVLTPFDGGPKSTFAVVGIFEGQRAAEFQPPIVYAALADVQELKGEAGIASAIDIMLTDASPEALAKAKSAVLACIADRNLPVPYRVDSAEARQMLLSEAQRITKLLLMLIAFVALLTSFFIILSTQSVSLFQRRAQLGIMRCLGTTRAQLAGLLFAELVPIGLAGTALGIALGVGAIQVAELAASEYFLRLYLSSWGIGLAALSGIATTVLSAVVLIIQVGHVTPLEAVHVQARPVRLRVVYVCGVIGIMLLTLHAWMVVQDDRTLWLHGWFAAFGAGSLHFGYALLAPVAVVVLGRPIARGVGRLLGVDQKLCEEPFERTPWRSAGACWVLMVGLSLIVYIAVRGQGVLAVWNFPAKLPEVFVWSPKYVPGDMIERVKQLPGVGETTTSTDVECTIESGKSGLTARSLVDRFLAKLTRPVFVAGDPDGLLSMIKVAFVEGERDDAVAKLKRGGYVLLPPQTSRNHNLHLGDRVTVMIGRKSAEFEIAGVIQSPALDLAVTAFQAESYMQFAAASALLGTQKDLKEKFGLDLVSMFMCDIDLPLTTIPPSFDPSSLPDHTSPAKVAHAIKTWANSLPNEREILDKLLPETEPWLANPEGNPLTREGRSELVRYGKAIRHVAYSARTATRSRDENWTALRERLLLLKICKTMNRPDAIRGSLRRLKEEIDQGMRRAILVITWLPAILLAVAAIGIGNLMMVSVHQRARQIAVLRAVGALKSQIVRLVLAEAITLGLLGSVIGVALGFHEAYSVNRIAADLLDVSLEFIVPLGTVAGSVLLTVAVCLFAGIIPARHAARNNIVQAMQAT